MLEGKKADASMIILILVIIFFLTVSFLVVNYVGVELTKFITETALNDTVAAPRIVDSMETITTKTIDNGLLFMIAFLIIGIIVSSFLVRIHVIWLFLYIIFLGTGIFLAVFLGNAYQDLTEAAVFATTISNMPKTIWIMQNIVKIILGAGALSMIIIFSKIFREGGYIERI